MAAMTPRRASWEGGIKEILRGMHVFRSRVQTAWSPKGKYSCLVVWTAACKEQDSGPRAEKGCTADHPRGTGLSLPGVGRQETKTQDLQAHPQQSHILQQSHALSSRFV